MTTKGHRFGPRTGRPPLSDEPTTTYNLTLYARQLTQLRAIARTRRISVAALLRIWIDEVLKVKEGQG